MRIKVSVMKGTVSAAFQMGKPLTTLAVAQWQVGDKAKDFTAFAHETVSQRRESLRFTGVQRVNVGVK